jgi:hypothetical protein
VTIYRYSALESKSMVRLTIANRLIPIQFKKRIMWVERMQLFAYLSLNAMMATIRSKSVKGIVVFHSARESKVSFITTAFSITKHRITGPPAATALVAFCIINTFIRLIL